MGEGVSAQGEQGGRGAQQKARVRWRLGHTPPTRRRGHRLGPRCKDPPTAGRLPRRSRPRTQHAPGTWRSWGLCGRSCARVRALGGGPGMQPHARSPRGAPPGGPHRPPCSGWADGPWSWAGRAAGGSIRLPWMGRSAKFAGTAQRPAGARRGCGWGGGNYGAVELRGGGPAARWASASGAAAHEACDFEGALEPAGPAAGPSKTHRMPTGPHLAGTQGPSPALAVPLPLWREPTLQVLRGPRPSPIAPSGV